MGNSPFTKQLRDCAVAAKNYALAKMQEVIESASADLEALESGKADKPEAVSCTIPTSGWSSDSTKDYPQYYDIAVTGLTAKDRAEVTLAPSGLDTAVQCGMCQTCETLAGKIRLRAASVPASDIAAEFWIEQGKG